MSLGALLPFWIVNVDVSEGRMLGVGTLGVVKILVERFRPVVTSAGKLARLDLPVSKSATYSM